MNNSNTVKYLFSVMAFMLIRMSCFCFGSHSELKHIHPSSTEESTLEVEFTQKNLVPNFINNIHCFGISKQFKKVIKYNKPIPEFSELRLPSLEIEWHHDERQYDVYMVRFFGKSIKIGDPEFFYKEQGFWVVPNRDLKSDVLAVCKEHASCSYFHKNLEETST